jgi:bacterioferritin-associated ferredoxin
VSRVYRALGCAPRCGKCVSMVRQMVEDAAATPDSPTGA